MFIADEISDSQPDFHVLTQGTKIGSGWIKKGDTSGKHLASTDVCCPRFGYKKFYANLDKAVSQDDEHLYAVIWNLVD